MKIEFHYTYLLMALSFILTGYFSNIIVFTSIIIVHELGHYIVAKLCDLKPKKIIIYPYGGITKIDIPLNTKINKELYIAISGVIFQSIYYLFIVFLYEINFIRDYIFNEFTAYHYSIVIFNLLPIHPLDGAKILNLLLLKVFPYKLTLKLNVYISIVILIIVMILNYYAFNYTTILIISIIVDNIIKYYREINYLFNKFLLERYLYMYKYNEIKKITKIDNMYKEKRHVIKEKNKYFTEKQLLKQRFDKKY